jgi:hypothetical protein
MNYVFNLVLLIVIGMEGSIKAASHTQIPVRKLAVFFEILKIILIQINKIAIQIDVTDVSNLYIDTQHKLLR